MKKAISKIVPANTQAIPTELLSQIQNIVRLADEHIDTTDPDAPELTDWSDAARGRFYRPNKKLKSLRMDEDVLAYFQAQGPGYQTRINRVLRASMIRGQRRQRQSIQKK